MGVAPHAADQHRLLLAALERVDRVDLDAQRLARRSEARRLGTIGRDHRELAGGSPAASSAPGARHPARPRRGSAAVAPSGATSSSIPCRRCRGRGAGARPPGCPGDRPQRVLRDGGVRGQLPAVEGLRGERHHLHVHPVLHAEHLPHPVTVRPSIRLEQAGAEPPRRRLLRDHGGRQLAVVSGEDHPLGPEEGERVIGSVAWVASSTSARAKRRGDSGGPPRRAACRRSPPAPSSTYRTAFRSRARASSISFQASACSERALAKRCGFLPRCRCRRACPSSSNASSKQAAREDPVRMLLPADVERVLDQPGRDPCAGCPTRAARSPRRGRARAGGRRRRCSRRCRGCVRGARRRCVPPRRARCSSRSPAAHGRRRGPGPRARARRPAAARG